MSSASKMTRKVILVSAGVTADVALERMFIPMAAHVNGIEDVIRELDVTVEAFLGLVLGGTARQAIGSMQSLFVVFNGVLSRRRCRHCEWRTQDLILCEGGLLVLGDLLW